MTIKLYSTLGSPAARGTILTIRALGLKDEIEMVNVDLFALDHLKPEFVAKNPLHSVPVLEDDGFVLWDSHAINAYLVNKYAENDLLYPKDPEKRALADSMAHFDTGYLFARGVLVVRAVFTQDESADLEKLKKDVFEVIDLLEIVLKKRTFVAGEQMTIADLSIVATLSTIEVYLPLDPHRYPKIAAWYRKMKALPYYDINEKGVQVFRAIFSKMAAKL